ncbi:hypothetical protein CCMA1212_009242 [Trichoderma ghanense]|uniref:SSCRP protein n=1 Tax=Trichoderma ghanense TaxID=65468 RepID=A0ABY2GT44_9HYPO
MLWEAGHVCIIAYFVLLLLLLLLLPGNTQYGTPHPLPSPVLQSGSTAAATIVGRPWLSDKGTNDYRTGVNIRENEKNPRASSLSTVLVTVAAAFTYIPPLLSPLALPPSRLAMRKWKTRQPD